MNFASKISYYTQYDKLNTCPVCMRGQEREKHRGLREPTLANIWWKRNFGIFLTDLCFPRLKLILGVFIKS